MTGIEDTKTKGTPAQGCVLKAARFETSENGTSVRLGPGWEPLEAALNECVDRSDVRAAERAAWHAHARRQEKSPFLTGETTSLQMKDGMVEARSSDGNVKVPFPDLIDLLTLWKNQPR